MNLTDYPTLPKPHPLPETLNTPPIEPPQCMPSSALHCQQSSCAMQTSSFEAPQNVFHWEMINKDWWSACLQRTDVHMELMMPNMEGYQGLTVQGLGTGQHGSATIWWCWCPSLHCPAYHSSSTLALKTSLCHHPSAKGTGSSSHTQIIAPLLVGVPHLHWFGWEVVVQAESLVASYNMCPSIINKTENKLYVKWETWIGLTCIIFSTTLSALSCQFLAKGSPSRHFITCSLAPPQDSLI